MGGAIASLAFGGGRVSKRRSRCFQIHDESSSSDGDIEDEYSFDAEIMAALEDANRPDLSLPPEGRMTPPNEPEPEQKLDKAARFRRSIGAPVWQEDDDEDLDLVEMVAQGSAQPPPRFRNLRLMPCTGT